MPRYRNALDNDVATVHHLAGPVAAGVERRRGQLVVVDRRQACARCGRQLAHHPKACFFGEGDVVDERLHRTPILLPGAGRGGVDCGPPCETVGAMRYVAYVRVSTDRQADDGQGLEVQEKACRAWARARGHRIGWLLTDGGFSGSADVLDRPGLAAALAAVSAEGAAGVVVYRLDRLARDLVLQEQLIAELRRHKAELHSCSQAEDAFIVDDPADPARRMIRRTLGIVAEYERDMIRLRMAAGRRQKQANGGYAGGRPTYGWRAEGRELVCDPAEQAVLERIARMRRAGASWREIAGALNALDLLPRTGIWHPSSVRRAQVGDGMRRSLVRKGTDRLGSPATSPPPARQEAAAAATA